MQCTLTSLAPTILALMLSLILAKLATPLVALIKAKARLIDAEAAIKERIGRRYPLKMSEDGKSAKLDDTYDPSAEDPK